MKKTIDAKTDVLVLGGGPAGIAAAIAAARTGADVTLVERFAFLGGNLVGGLCLHTFHDTNMNQVIHEFPQELIDRLRELGGTIGPVEIKNAHMRTTTPIDHELMKYLLMKMMDESGVKVLLHSFAADVETADGKIRCVVVETKSDRRRIEAKIYVDATGDGDIAAWGGASMRKGRDGDGKMQAASLVFKMSGVDVDRALDKIAVGRADVTGPDGKPQCMWFSANLDKYSQQLAAANIFPFPQHTFWGNAFRRGEVNLNITRVIDLDPTDAEELTRMEFEGRFQLYKISEFLKKNVPGFEKSYVVSSVPFIGIRETRRIVGEYVLGDEDVLEGRKFEDAVARSSYPVDVHDPDGKGTYFSQVKNSYYDIPYRCLLPWELENLLMAGRCISTSSKALASSRTMVNVLLVGQAAGTAAALCAKAGTGTRQVDLSRLQQLLKA